MTIIIGLLALALCWVNVDSVCHKNIIVKLEKLRTDADGETDANVKKQIVKGILPKIDDLAKKNCDDQKYDTANNNIRTDILKSVGLSALGPPGPSRAGPISRRAQHRWGPRAYHRPRFQRYSKFTRVTQNG